MSNTNTAAFEEEVNNHYHYLINLATYYVNDRYLAEDLVQDAMLKAYKKMNQFKGDSSYKTYLSRILINTIKDHFKKKKLFTIPILNNVTHSKKEKSSYEYLIQDETKKEIYRCINELKEEYKSVFILREVLEYSYDEISETLDLPINTVKTRISRARKKVRELINEEVLFDE